MSNAPSSPAASPAYGTAKKSYLPEIGSPGYYLLLGAIAIFILGPLGGITAAYMNFSLGFFVGGQVLAGILGSAVTYGYGAEGKHGANYMQTMAASVASMAAMAVLIQAMTWLGLPMPPDWQLVLFFTCVGMFGVGVGMLYTPTLVDRMQLQYPSGFAVANILRALTDIRLLKRSIGQLGSGTVLGMVIPLSALRIHRIDEIGLSSSTIGAGMIVGARIGIAGAVMGFLGKELTPYLVSIGWLDEGKPFRKIGFIIALGMILGATAVDMVLIIVNAVKRFREKAQTTVAPGEDWKQTNTQRLFAWVAFWGLAVLVVATMVLHVPMLYVGIALVLCFFFVMGNGISTGISDSNPISSAFVITVFILAAFGLKEPGIGLMAAAVLLIATSTGVDMQQDRSTGWRLGTNRVIQFRYQVIGIVMGAVMAVGLAKVFMKAYPVLKVNQFTTHVEGAEQWGSAMTYKFVGALEGLTNPKPFVTKALFLGIAIGLVTEVLRKLIKGNAGYKKFVQSGKTGFVTDFCLDSFFLPSPYASSFGGFVEFPVTLWFALGGVITSSVQTISDATKKPKALQPVIAPPPAMSGNPYAAPVVEHGNVAESEGGELPEDMSATSLIGGGLIAGESLAALGIGLYGLLSTVL
jgi:uncharacterized oligopeptide transporter (OPT) family protein